MKTESPNTLKEMIMLIKLVTGEMLMTICLNMDDKGMFVAFPYQIVHKMKVVDGVEKEIPYLQKYCPFVKNQTFGFSFSNIIFAKDPIDSYIETYIEVLEALDKDGIVDLFTMISNGQSAKNMANSDNSFFSNVLRDDSITLDENLNVIMTGNSTSH